MACKIYNYEYVEHGFNYEFMDCELAIMTNLFFIHGC